MSVTDAPALVRGLLWPQYTRSIRGGVLIVVVLQPLGRLRLVYSCLCQPTTWVELKVVNSSDVKVEVNQVK